MLAFATDYDRTLTDESLHAVPEALRALADARARGIRIVIVSGRDLPFLEREVGHLADAIVAENGCIIRGPLGVVPAEAGAAGVQAALDELGIPVEYGTRIASIDAGEADRARVALARRGIDADLVFNRDRVMVLPPGVDKAAGLRDAFRLLGVDPLRAVAAGDGENDVPMLRLVGHGIAVANAVGELKEVADEVLDEPGGLGIASWLKRAILTGRTRV